MIKFFFANIPFVFFLTCDLIFFQCVAPPCHPGRFGIQICFFFSEKLYIYRNEVRNQTEQNAWSPQTIVINFNVSKIKLVYSKKCHTNFIAAFFQLFHLMIGMMKTLLLKYLLFAAILVNSVDSGKDFKISTSFFVIISIK